jgi:hypothetical protein
VLSRRTFLQRFGIGVGAALALASLTEAAVDGLTELQAANRCACEYLRKIYNDTSHAWFRAQGGPQHPERLYVSRGLYDALEGEFQANERFMSARPAHPSQPHLMFKAAEVYADPTLTGWDIRIPQPPRRRIRLWNFRTGTYLTHQLPWKAA